MASLRGKTPRDVGILFLAFNAASVVGLVGYRLYLLSLLDVQLAQTVHPTADSIDIPFHASLPYFAAIAVIGNVFLALVALQYEGGKPLFASVRITPLKRGLVEMVALPLLAAPTGVTAYALMRSQFWLALAGVLAVYVALCVRATLVSRNSSSRGQPSQDVIESSS